MSHRDTRGRGAAAPPSAGDLERLLETERRLEELVRGARHEAEAIERAARDDARRREEASGAELASAVRALEADVAAETDRRATALGAESAREAARYAAVPPGRVAALAQQAVTRLLSEEAP